MRRTLPILGALAALALAGAGCPIWIDEHGDGGRPVCIDETCSCTEHYECDLGQACIDGVCRDTGTCFYGDPCPTGYVCDSTGTCVPVVTCTEDADCVLGYCDLAGTPPFTCVRTGPCITDIDCRGYGDSFICDERGICVPDRGPCPDGNCGCAGDYECEGGWLCEGSICRDPATLCRYNYQCEPGAVCLNSLCRVDCSGGAPCPTGQICDADACIDDPDGNGGEIVPVCVYSSDCGDAELCVNGYCTVACTSGGECAAFEGCQSSLCRPDVERVADCTASSCTGGLSCVDGVCRMPCAAEINCAGSAPFLRCDAAFCHTDSELATSGACARQAQCGTGDCLDGLCR